MATLQENFFKVEGELKENCVKALEKKIQGAWLARICACMLGKPIECLWKEDIWKILESSDNFPLNRYIKTTDIKEDMKHVGWILNRPFIDKIKIKI